MQMQKGETKMDALTNATAQYKSICAKRAQLRAKKEVQEYLQVNLQLYKARVNAILSNKAEIQALIKTDGGWDTNINWDNTNIAMQILQQELYEHACTLLMVDENANADIGGHANTSTNAVVDEYAQTFTEVGLRSDVVAITYLTNL